MTPHPTQRELDEFMNGQLVIRAAYLEHVSKWQRAARAQRARKGLQMNGFDISQLLTALESNGISPDKIIFILNRLGDPNYTPPAEPQPDGEGVANPLAGEPLFEAEMAKRYRIPVNLSPGGGYSNEAPTRNPDNTLPGKPQPAGERTYYWPSVIEWSTWKRT